MTCGNDGNCKKRMALCPLSFGLALGITAAIAVFIWSIWVMKFGMPSLMVGHMFVPTHMADVGMLVGWCFLKGFVFGVVFAFLYDFISCCCKARCCNKPDGCSSCGCKPCNCGNKSKPSGV